MKEGGDPLWLFNSKRWIYFLFFFLFLEWANQLFYNVSNITETMHILYILKRSFKCGSFWDRDWEELLFRCATLLRNHKNYRDSIMPVGSSASLLWLTWYQVLTGNCILVQLATVYSSSARLPAYNATKDSKDFVLCATHGTQNMVMLLPIKVTPDCLYSTLEIIGEPYYTLNDFPRLNKNFKKIK